MTAAGVMKAAKAMKAAKCSQEAPPLSTCSPCPFPLCHQACSVHGRNPFEAYCSHGSPHMGIHEWTRAGSAGSAATGSAAKRPPQEAGPAPGGLAPPAKRRRVENFQPPNSIPIDCTTKQTQDSQDRYGDDDIETTRKAMKTQGDTKQTQDSQDRCGDDDVGLVSLEGMTALSSLLDPAENDTEVLGIFDPAGCEVTVSVETKVSEVTGWTAWEFKIDTKGTNEGHAAVDHAHTTTKNTIPTTTE